MIRRFDFKKIIYLAIVAIILATVLFPLFVYRDKLEAPEPQNGVLDLSNLGFGQGLASLAGDWEFYWNRLYTYEDFQSGAAQGKQYVYVPKTWNSYAKDGQKLAGFGYATYRLKVVVRDAGQPIGLRVDSMSTAYRLFVNGEEIASNGTVGTGAETSKPQYLPVVVDFEPPAKEFYIIIQVSNFTYARGGIWYDINMGTPGQIETLNRAIIYKDAILIGSLLIMALYYTSFYIVLQRDKTSKYFIFLCLAFICRTSLYGDMLLIRLIPSMPFRLRVFLDYTTIYWITIIIYLMLESIYTNKLRFNFKKIFVIYGIAATVFTAVLPIHVYTSLITAIEVIGGAMAFFPIILVIKAQMKGEKGAAIILFAILVILAAGVHDVLYQANVIHHSLGELNPAGIFLFMFTFSFTIASRLSDAYEQSKWLSSQLAESLEKEKQAADELVKTELSFLKAQIRPHFIYNSISVIAALTVDDPYRAKNLLYDLSDYLRGSFRFDNCDGMTPLSDELETVKAYVSIEKARFQDKLTVEYDIDENVSVFVPLLTIQPIVENAVRHGIFRKPEGGRITLRVYRETDCVVVEVEDDGVGMSESEIAEILKSEGPARGVGLKNISRRLDLCYGKSLEIKSEAGKGTLVAFRIPQEGGRTR